MKKYSLLLLLTLLFFSSCGTKENNNKTDLITEQATELVETTDSLSTDISTTSFTTTIEEVLTAKSEEPVLLMNEPYSFSEVNPLFGPDFVSVNELSELFGTPSFIMGYFYDRNVENPYYVISVMFEDVKFDLAANHGEDIDLSPTDNERFEVPESSLSISLQPQNVSIWSENLELPRGIQIGNSIETLYDAYKGNRGKERQAQGVFLVSYDYGESGSITYHFNDTSEDGIIGALEQVSIEWYNTVMQDNSMQFIDEDAPPA